MKGVKGYAPGIRGPGVRWVGRCATRAWTAAAKLSTRWSVLASGAGRWIWSSVVGSVFGEEGGDSGGGTGESVSGCEERQRQAGSGILSQEKAFESSPGGVSEPRLAAQPVPHRVPPGPAL